MRGSSRVKYIIKAGGVHSTLTGIRGVSRGKAKHHKAGTKNSFGFSEVVDSRTALVLFMDNTRALLHCSLTGGCYRFIRLLQVALLPFFTMFP